MVNPDDQVGKCPAFKEKTNYIFLICAGRNLHTVLKKRFFGQVKICIQDDIKSNKFRESAPG